jgi:hypothetical protein
MQARGAESSRAWGTKHGQGRSAGMWETKFKLGRPNTCVRLDVRALAASASVYRTYVTKNHNTRY